MVHGAYPVGAILCFLHACPGWGGQCPGIACEVDLPEVPQARRQSRDALGWSLMLLLHYGYFLCFLTPCLPFLGNPHSCFVPAA
jgi:hypothetical protein